MKFKNYITEKDKNELQRELMNMKMTLKNSLKWLQENPQSKLRSRYQHQIELIKQRIHKKEEEISKVK